MRLLVNAVIKTSAAVPVVTFSLALAVSPIPSNAHSSKPHPFKSASISFDSAGAGRTNAEGHRDADFVTLQVGHDGSKYTKLIGDVAARFRLKAKVKAGHRIYGWVVSTGDPANESMLPDSVKGAETNNVKTKSLDTIANFAMSAKTAVSTGSWGSNPTSVQDVINKCNAAFSELPASDQDVGEIELTIHAGIAANRRRGLQQAGEGWYANGRSRPAIAHTTLPVHIVCIGDPYRSAENLPPPRAGNTLHSIDLKVSQHGERCPKDVTVTTYADYRWQAKSRMRLQVNNGFLRRRIVKTRKVTFAGKTFHRAEAEFKLKLDPGQKTFKLTVDGGKKKHNEIVDISCPPFKVTSAWLKYEVEDTPTCPKKVKETATFHTTRPGWVKHEIRMQGGLVVSSGKLTSKRDGDQYVATAVRKLTMNAIDKDFMADAIDYPANSGWTPLKVDCLELAGDFSYVDHGSPKCSRDGKALISFKSNRPENIRYSLNCSNGKHFSGYVKPQKHSQKGYIAAALQTFEVDKTDVYSCALKTAQRGPAKLHKWKSHTFECATRAVETGSDDIQTARPTTPDDSQTPGRPATLVTNDAKKDNGRVGGLSSDTASVASFCTGGRLHDGKCICRPGWTPKPTHIYDHGVLKRGFKCIPGATDGKLDPSSSDNGSRVPGRASDMKRDARKEDRKTLRDARAARRRLQALKKKRAIEARKKRLRERRAKALAEAKKKAALRRKAYLESQKKARAEKRRQAAQAAALRRRRTEALRRRKEKLRFKSSATGRARTERAFPRRFQRRR